MRNVILGVLAISVLTSASAWGRTYDRSLAVAAIRGHHLLTPEQLACVAIVDNHKGGGQVSSYTVFTAPHPGCDANEPAHTRLFDIYVDRTDSTVQWAVDPTELVSLL